MRSTLNLIAAVAMVSVSATAASAQNASQYLTVEGGAACSKNRATVIVTNGVDTVKLGDDGCSGTGSVETGRTGAPVIGVFDHWAVRGRFTSLVDKEETGTFTATQKDRRFVLDAEIGTKTNILNFFGGTERVTIGARFAHWNASVSDVMPTSLDASSFGIGPRIGMRSSSILWTHFVHESQMGASALIGRASGMVSGRAVTYGLDTSSSLGYMLDGKESGRVFSVGMFSEYWFNNFEGVSGNVRRHSSGPFLRFRMPLP
jgi:hypothetical protein